MSNVVIETNTTFFCYNEIFHKTFEKCQQNEFHEILEP